jgi:hypothetical protein
MTRRKKSWLLAVLLFSASAETLRADFITSFAYTDRGVYSGTFTRHTTLNDAQAGLNAVTGPVLIAPMDLSMFFVRNVPSGIGPSYDMLVNGGVGGNTAQFYNQWFYSTTPNPGFGNPNNSDQRFIQIDDYNGSTPVSHRGFWTSGTYDTFRLEVSGENALATPGDPDGEPDRSRMAQPGIIPGSNPNAFGNWVSYNLDLTFGGLNGVVDNGIAPGFIRSNGDPTSISGSFLGVFQMNDQSANPYYRVSFSISQGNTYGFVNANNLDPANPYLASTFGSVQVSVIPAPPAMVLAGIGAIVGLWVRRRQ